MTGPLADGSLFFLFSFSFLLQVELVVPSVLHHVSCHNPFGECVNIFSISLCSSFFLSFPYSCSWLPFIISYIELTYLHNPIFMVFLDMQFLQLLLIVGSWTALNLQVSHIPSLHMDYLDLQLICPYAVDAHPLWVPPYLPLGLHIIHLILSCSLFSRSLYPHGFISYPPWETSLFLLHFSLGGSIPRGRVEDELPKKFPNYYFYFLFVKHICWVLATATPLLWE